MQYRTIEELRAMPIHLLQGIDIKSKEEEDLVQKALDEKRASMPIVVDLNISSSLTDFSGIDGKNSKGQTESELQAEIDLKKAEARAKFIPQEEISEVTASNEPPVMSEVTSTETVKKPFCDQCTSKGVRHKKGCPNKTF